MTLKARDDPQQLRKKLAIMVAAVKFYAEADTWFAVALFPDLPCGPIIDDYDEANDGRIRPGKRARAAIAAYNALTVKGRTS